MDENEAGSEDLDEEDDQVAGLQRPEHLRHEGTWTDSEKAMVQGAYDSVSAAWRLLLDCGGPAQTVLGHDEDALHAVVEPLAEHYENTVLRSADLVSGFFLEAGTRGPRHQQSAHRRAEAADILADAVQGFAAFAEFGAKALSDQGSQCVGQALSASPDSNLFGVWMRLLTASSVGVEIAELAREGFAEAVHARARSLHESAVIATVLNKYAKEPELEIIDRYWEYQFVRQYKGYSRADRRIAEVRERQAESEQGGGREDKAWQQQLREAKREYDRVISRYGKGFAQDYGWARNLVPADKRVTLSELESLAGGGLHSLDYMLASTRVHPSYTFELDLVSVLRDGLRQANSAWLHLVHAQLSLLEEDYPTPEPRLHKETATALFQHTDQALDDVRDWIEHRREELEELMARGEEALKKRFDALRDLRGEDDDHD